MQYPYRSFSHELRLCSYVGGVIDDAARHAPACVACVARAVVVCSAEVIGQCVKHEGTAMDYKNRQQNAAP